MKFIQRAAVPAVLTLLAACSENEGATANVPVEPATVAADAPITPATFSYEVAVTNLTAAQPLSPLAVVAHGGVYSAFDLGTASTAGLEELAEGGDNTAFLAEAAAMTDVVATVSGEGVVAPGATSSVTVSVEGPDTTGLEVSGVTMLVNTNDAITAFRGIPVQALALGQSVTMNMIGYDAGTEANSEAPGTIPGPADGGEGFNAARDDIADEVRGHGGVVTATDGLMTSVLGENHRWDNPIARVTITRVE